MLVKKLSREEVEARPAKRGRAPLDLSEYLDALQSLEDGEGLEITYEDNDSRKAHVLRFNRAAKQLGVKLAWDYTKGTNQAFVRVNGPAEAEESGEQSTEEATPRRRRSRRSEAAPEEVAA